MKGRRLELVLRSCMTCALADWKRRETYHSLCPSRSKSVALVTASGARDQAASWRRLEFQPPPCFFRPLAVLFLLALALVTRREYKAGKGLVLVRPQSARFSENIHLSRSRKNAPSACAPLFARHVSVLWALPLAPHLHCSAAGA